MAQGNYQPSGCAGYFYLIFLSKKSKSISQIDLLCSNRFCND